MRITWSTASLMTALKPIYQRLVKQKRKGRVKNTWWAVGFCLPQLALALAALVQGTYHFSPMQQFPYQGETIRLSRPLHAPRLAAHYQTHLHLILFQTKRQFQKGRKTLFSILRSLKLSLSPHKSWMGKLTRGFHFLGIDFRVAKPEVKNQRRITIHPRSCTRALDKVKAMTELSVHPATIQRYLANWARWWSQTVEPLSFPLLLIAWFSSRQFA